MEVAEHRGGVPCCKTEALCERSSHYRGLASKARRRQSPLVLYKLQKGFFFFLSIHQEDSVLLSFYFVRTDNFFIAMNRSHQFRLQLKFEIPMFAEIFLACKQILMVDTGSTFSLCSRIHLSNTSSISSQ